MRRKRDLFGPPHFWRAAAGFWRPPGAAVAWSMTAVPIGATEPRLAPLFRLNYWSRDFFDAFGRRDAVTLQAEALLFPLLAGARILVAVLTISARMTTQRKWRACLSRNLIARWLGGDYPGLAECLSSVNCVTAPRAGLDDLENDGIGR